MEIQSYALCSCAYVESEREHPFTLMLLTWSLLLFIFFFFNVVFHSLRFGCLFRSPFFFSIQISFERNWAFVILNLWFRLLSQFFLLLSLVDFFEWLILICFVVCHFWQERKTKEQLKIKLMCAKEACNQSKRLLNDSCISIKFNKC